MKPDKPFIKDLTDDDLKEAIQRAIKKGEFFIARAITPQDKRLKVTKHLLHFRRNLRSVLTILFCINNFV